ncbi:Imm10 family immunity protein [Deinococcus oregonensis]|uniref:Imm10 family immunity protein n=1 Tax=Deinococcus oregonensis TaxID=1805970 RepID=A0ABV6AXN3_9DEIO
MTYSFIARGVAVGEFEEFETYLVALRDDPQDPQDEFQIQHSLFQDEQDEELGMDTYCIVLSGGTTHYGGITSCILRHHVLEIELNDQARAMLEIERIRVELQLDAARLAVLRDGLNHVLKDDRDEPAVLILE